MKKCLYLITIMLFFVANINATNSVFMGVREVANATNLPEKGATIKESPIPSIFFSWTPRHMNSLTAAYGTEYEFTLVEIYDRQVPPESAFMYSRVLYTETVRSTSFIHTAAQPMLQPWMRYAWRVRAVAREGLNEISIFRNDGYSPIYYFDYTADCPTVKVAGALYESGHVNITWEDVGAMDYVVEYRKKGSDNWYKGSISTPGLCKVYNLQFGQEYEYRIGTRCMANGDFLYNDIRAFRIPQREERKADCGMMPDINLSNQTAAVSLQPGLPIRVGDFLVFVTQVSGSGRFSGEGYVGIPYFENAQVAVTFNDIVVNTDNQLISGYIETRYDTKNNNLLLDINETLTGGKGVGDIRSGDEKATFVVDYNINPNIPLKPLKADTSKDDIKDTGGNYNFAKGENGKYEFVITDDKGKEHKIETESIPFTIKDKDGNVFEASETGELKQISSSSDISLPAETRETPRTDIAVVEFQSTDNTKYAVDNYRDIYAKVTEYFLAYKPETKEMIASAKLMLPGASDEIFVKVVESGNSFNPDKVRFVTGNGQEYKGEYDASKGGWRVTLAGSAANDGQSLYVVYEESSGKHATIARLNIYSYEPKTVKVKLVPVNGFTNGFTASSVSSQLNAIYNKVSITCEVEIAPSFGYTFANGTFNVTGSGFFSTLTDDMKSLNKAYQQANPNNKDICLFMIENVTGADGVAGDMPRGKQFGYLFKGSTAQTIAHEIGHGIFHLDHPFDRANGAKSFAKGDLADNLMEYSGGTNLIKLQWDMIHAPGLVIGIFEKDEDTQAVIENNPKAISRIVKSIQCAKSRNEKETELYFPTNSFEAKIKDIASALNIMLPDCRDEKISVYISNNDNSVFGNDYVQDLFNVFGITFNDSGKQMIIKGKKASCFISASDKFSNKADCVYKFIKSLIDITNQTNNYNLLTPTLDDVQYASPCEIETIKIEDRKSLLREASKAENWYNSSVKDSRQKIAIQLIETTPNNDKAAMYDFLEKDLALINTLYDKVDDYRDELLKAIIELWKSQNKNVVADQHLSIVQFSLAQRNTFLDIRNDGTYVLRVQYFTGGNPYSGYEYGSVETKPLRPFDAVNISAYTSFWSNLISGKEDQVLLNVPSIVGRSILSEAHTQEFYNYLTLGFSMVGVSEITVALKMLSAGVKNVTVWTKLALGVSDVLTMAIEEYVKGNPNTEFSKTWAENRTLIYGSLLAANVTNAVITQYTNRAKQLEDLYRKETGGELGSVVAKGGMHANWVEVLDIRNKIIAKKPHVLTIENLSSTRTYNGQTLEGFTGCHSEKALQDYISTHGGIYQIKGKPVNLLDDVVFEGQPVITIGGMDYVKTNGIMVEYAPGKHGGTSSFFPKNWDEARILDEVEHAIANNHGKINPTIPSGNEYFGFSKDGKVEIHFYLNQDGSINSFFPKK